MYNPFWQREILFRSSCAGELEGRLCRWHAPPPAMQPRSPRRSSGLLHAHMPSPSCSVLHGESLFSVKFVAGGRFMFPADHSSPSRPACCREHRAAAR